MSLLPPTPIVLSKMKYFIKKRYEEDKYSLVRDEILDVLGPFPIFKIKVEFRNAVSLETFQYKDLDDLIPMADLKDDCIDIMLNLMIKITNKLKETIIEPGHLRVSIIYCNDEKEENKKWYDLFVDEKPINITGLRTGDESFSSDTK